MATCIINNRSNRAFVLYEELIKRGVILIFDSNNRFLFSVPIINTNSIELNFRDVSGKIKLITFYRNTKLIKEIHIGIEQNN